MFEKMLLLKILIILTLLFLPLGELVRFDLGNSIFFKPLDVIAFVLLVWSTIVYFRKKPKKFFLKNYYFYFPLIGLISLVINSYWLGPQEFLASLLYLL